MKRLATSAFCTVLFLALATGTHATLLYWSGINPTGWRAGATPVNGDDISLGNAINQDVTLTGSITLNAVVFAPDGDKYTINSASAVTLGLSGGLVAGDSNFGRLVIGQNVTLSIAGSQGFDAGNNSIVIYSKLTGTGSPVFLAKNNGGSFLFVNLGGPNDYTGNTIVGNGSDAPIIAFWNGSPFSSGSVNILNGATLIAHNTQTVANNFTLNSAGSSNPLFIRSWDAPLTFTGTITLANHTTITAQASPAAFGSTNGAGSVPVPGQMQRNPIIFSGNIGESVSNRSLTVQGQGIAILSGANAYTGGTTVNGALIFGTNASIPATGTVLINANGYAGLGDVTPGNFAAQFGSAQFNKTSTGAVGVDTLPGNATVTYGSDINLSSTGTGATAFTAGNIRLGTATSAILTGTITPQGINYLFGNGGGTLYVQSNLGDTTYTGTTSRQVQLNNTGPVPLKLFLQGTNAYTFGTGANSGLVVFDGASAIPNFGQLSANGTSTFVGSSYIGYTDSAGINTGSVIGANAAAFLAKFNRNTTWGIIGFDTHAGNATVDISGAVDLSNVPTGTSFNDGVYLGTATSAIISGPITPTNGSNGDNAAHTLRLTAANGGTLTVSSALADGGPALALMLGSPGSANPYFSNGTVNLTGTNTYSGGTTLNANGQGLTIGVGSNNAFGSGLITIAAPNGGLVGLQALAPGLAVSNNLTFANYAGLYLQGSNALSLTGTLAGSGALHLQRATNDTTGAATLSGDNSAFSGEIDIQNATLALKNNHAAGQANLNFSDSSSTVVFGGAATAPVLYGISGDTGRLVLPNATGTTLTFQMDDETTHDGDFGGIISGAAGAATDAAVVVTASNNTTNGTLYLYGHNAYSGGTSITGYGVLGLGANDSAGYGTVTVSATDGGLILNTGVTFTNALVFNSGGLAGLGTFQPSSVSGTGQTAGKLTFGANQMVFAGIPGGDTQVPGALTIATNVAFAPGGTLHEMIQDPTLLSTSTLSAGTSLLYVQGNLDLSLLGASSFTLAVETVTDSNQRGFSTAIAWGQAYVIPFVETTGTITGFNANQFTFDTSKFQGGMAGGSGFLVTQDATHLYLNFTAVPEPSTWALLVTGAGLIGLTALRRRA